MNQSFIDALMHFFSLLTLPLPGRNTNNLRLKLEDYIDKAGIAFPVEECLKLFNTYSGKYFFELCSNAYQKEEDAQKMQRHLILESGQKAQENLYLQERILLILSLLEFNKLKNNQDEIFLGFVGELSKSLNISDKDFSEALDFIHGNHQYISEKDLILEEKDESEELEGEWINQNTSATKADKKKRIREKVKSNIRFHFFDSYVFIAFIYKGDHSLFINEKRTYPDYFYSFRRKDILQFEGLEPITFEEIEELFEISALSHKIILSGKNISYRYEKTNYTIKPFSFQEESGQIIGIVGNNRVGKSTILRLISNEIPPLEGKLSINGTDMVQNKYRLRSVTAFVSQGITEFEDLTVYENLLFQAHLTLGNLTMEDIKKRIDDTLEKFSLNSVKNIQAGSLIRAKISDFQRICLRIAIELIRNPYIMYLDEPLSGLSFSDSKKLLSILKDEAQKGKLIILTSQLPTSDIYNMFDKVWLVDHDGYMIFNGPPSASLTFFRNTGLLPYYYIQSKTDLVNAEDVIKIVETKKIHSDGSISDKRHVAPGTWYDAWRAESVEDNKITNTEVKPLPIINSSLPGIEKQFLVYLFRNFRIRSMHRNSIILNLLGVPLAGVLIALITRLTVDGDYLLYHNNFLPLCFFLTINLLFLTSLFSASEEIYQERKQLKRDRNLNLSVFSYKNAKIVHILLQSVLQAILFSLGITWVLGIKNLFIDYSFIFFSIAACGNLLALSLSSAIKKINSLFIIIPFLVIPNMIFTGYLIPFNSAGFKHKVSDPVPVIADLSPCRWAYEAIMVEQFKQNNYEKYFFSERRELYQSKYTLDNLLPFLFTELNKCQDFKYSQQDTDSLKYSLGIIQQELLHLTENKNIAPFETLSDLNINAYDSTIYDEAFGYLTYLRFLMENLILDSESNIRKKNEFLIDSLSGLPLEKFKYQHTNRELEKILTNSFSFGSVQRCDEGITKTGSPVFLKPQSPYGQAHFFASEKKFNNQYLSTLRFNLTVIWILNLLLYILLLSDGLNILLKKIRN